MTEVFDKEELLEELDGDLEFLEESVEMLESDAPPLLLQIRKAVESGDAESVAVGAHTLKSMVGNFCAPLAFDAALRMEALGRDGDLTECKAKLDGLELEISRLQDSLRELLSEGK